MRDTFIGKNGRLIYDVIEFLNIEQFTGYTDGGGFWDRIRGRALAFRQPFCKN